MCFVEFADIRFGYPVLICLYINIFVITKIFDRHLNKYKNLIRLKIQY